jgi:hypothetical protein
MSLADLTSEEREVVRRAMEATLQLLGWDLDARIGVPTQTMRGFLDRWPQMDDLSDQSDGCLAINNSLNDLLHGLGITDEQALDFVGVHREELLRVYVKWTESRGWSATGVR